MVKFLLALLLGMSLGAAAVVVAVGSRLPAVPQLANFRLAQPSPETPTPLAVAPATPTATLPTVAPTSIPQPKPTDEPTIGGGTRPYGEGLLTELYERVSPSVVFIRSQLGSRGAARLPATPA